ncbi:MAG: DUF4296 domain-containing protein [Ferruginibacter sp.]
MRRLIFLLLFSAVLLSCGSNKIPSDIIGTNRMEVIMWQLMQSDEYVNKVVAKDSTKKSSTERMKIYQQVFDLNKTSMSEFKKSYQFYVAHPDIAKTMFDSITVKAARQRTDLYKPKPDTATSKADSLKHLRPDTLLQHKNDSLLIKPGAIKGKPNKQPLLTDTMGHRPGKRIRKH